MEGVGWGGGGEGGRGKREGRGGGSTLCSGAWLGAGASLPSHTHLQALDLVAAELLPCNAEDGGINEQRRLELFSNRLKCGVRRVQGLFYFLKSVFPFFEMFFDVSLL